MTNDGDFANKIMHPRNKVKKTYLVEINKPISNREIRAIERGVNLRDGRTAPAKVNVIRNKVLEVTIHEGKNRIIRRMFEKLGLRVFSLKRVSIGKLNLGMLKLKKYRYLTKKDIEKIFI